jgi:hypothetical protein
MKRPNKKRKQAKKPPYKKTTPLTRVGTFSWLQHKKLRLRLGDIGPEISYGLLLLILITIFGVVMYQLTHRTAPAQIQEIGQTAALKKFVKPENFISYTSSEGVTFAYPKEWGDVIKSQTDTVEFGFSKQKKTLRIRLTPKGFSTINGIEGDCSKSLQFNAFDTISSFDWSAHSQKGADFEIFTQTLLTTDSVHIDESFEHFSVFPTPGSCPGLRFNAYVALKKNSEYAGVSVLWYEYCPGVKTCGVETIDELTKYKADPTAILSLGDRNNLILFFKSISE